LAQASCAVLPASMAISGRGAAFLNVGAVRVPPILPQEGAEFDATCDDLWDSLWDSGRDHPVELDCPICYSSLCEPVMAGCGRHAFCRNCFLKSQCSQHGRRCPVCRRAMNLHSLMELVEELRDRDPHYEERVEVAKQERVDIGALVLKQMKAFHKVDNLCRVDHAGSVEAVDGPYAVFALPGYAGPKIYRHVVNPHMFIYQFRKQIWILAELHHFDSASVADERNWLYFAPVRPPFQDPPKRGWWAAPGVFAKGTPAPELRVRFLFERCNDDDDQ